MSLILVDEAVSNRKNKSSAPKPPTPARDRIDLRADPVWVARIEKQAERLGLNLSSYIRQAVTLKLEADEASDPDA